MHLGVGRDGDLNPGQQLTVRFNINFAGESAPAITGLRFNDDTICNSGRQDSSSTATAGPTGEHHAYVV